MAGYGMDSRSSVPVPYLTALRSALEPTLHTINRWFLTLLVSIPVSGFHIILRRKLSISANSINQFIFVMVKGCVFFEVRAKYFNIRRTWAS